MDRENVETATASLREGWHHTRCGPTVVIMAIEDEEEGRLWDEIAGLSGETA